MSNILKIRDKLFAPTSLFGNTATKKKKKDSPDFCNLSTIQNHLLVPQRVFD